MVSKLTLGQYISKNSFLHRVNPKVKLIFTFIFMIVLFFVTSFVSLGFCVCFIFFIYYLCKFNFKLMFNNLKMVFFVLIFATFFNIFFITSGTTIFKFMFLKITTDAVKLTIILILRIFILISTSSILTYTTLPFDLTLAIEEILKPLSKFKIPVNEISIMMSIALRFVPFLIEESNIIINAQKSRGLNLKHETNLAKKIKLLISFLIPLLVSSFKKADELAVSMESRCFRVGQKRTRYRNLQFRAIDFVVSIFGAVFLIIIFILNLKFYINIS